MALLQPSYLVIDQGGQSTRAVLFDRHGTVHAQAQCPVVLKATATGFVEYDAATIVSSVYHVLDDVLKQAGPQVISSGIEVALVTQRSSMVCWHRDSGEALSPVISWQDTRATDYLPTDSETLKRIHQRTGLVANGHYGATKMRWCLDHLPAVSAACHKGQLIMGPLAAFLVKTLTGNNSVDPANASRTLLMGIDSQDWDAELLALFSIEASCLPQIQPTASDFGVIHHAGMALPLRLVNGDQSAAFNGTGVLQPGVAYVNAGTGAFVATLLEGQQAPEQLLVSPVFCRTDPLASQRVCEGTVNGAASALEQISRQLGVTNYQDMDTWPEASHELPYFLNGIGGLGSPFWRPDFASRFIPLANSEATNREKLLAVLESIVFLLAVNIELLQKQGFSLNRIFLSGGLSRITLLGEWLSSVTALPVFRFKDLEATARGAAFQLAGFPEHWRFEQPQQGAVVEERQVGRHQRFQYWQALIPTASID